MTKYGYKPKAVDIEGMTAEQIQEMRRSPRVRLFKVAFGRDRGKTKMGDNVPWAGITAGATNTGEAIDKIREVNPILADNCTRFAAAASTAKGTRRIRYTEDGVETILPLAAAERGVTAGSLEIVGVA